MSSQFPREFGAIENIFCVREEKFVCTGRHATKLRRDAKNCDRARWLSERTRAIARSARNFVRTARDRLQEKFPFQSARVAANFFPRLSSSRNKFITFPWPHTSSFEEPLSAQRFIRGALEMALKHLCIARMLGQIFKPNRTDRNPDKLISLVCSAVKLSAAKREILLIHRCG